MQGLRKPRGSSEDNAELEGASDGEVGIDLDDCEDHEEDLEMTAAAGVLSRLAPSSLCISHPEPVRIACSKHATQP